MPRRNDEPESRPFNLTLYLAVTTLVALFVLTVGVTILFNRALTKSITIVSSRYAQVVTRGVSFQIFRDFTLPLRKRGIRVNLEDPAQLRELRRVVKGNLAGFGINYLEIYDADGNLVFASPGKEPLSPGDPLLQRALKGHIASSAFRQEVVTPSGEERTSELIGTCVPVGFRPLPPGGSEQVERFGGVFCLYQDVTGLLGFLNRVRLLVGGGVILLMAAFFVILMLFARHADRIIRRQTETIRQKNRELQELEKLKRDLTNMIVHDMKNPLTAVMGNIDLVLSGIGGEVLPRQREFLEQARLSSQKLLTMISNLLDISRMEEGRLELKREEFSLGEVVDEVVGEFRALAEREGKELVVEIPEGMPPMHADREMIRRVLANLVSNAVKHTFEGGHIWVTARVEGSDFVVSVRDDGEGIPPEYHEKIFEKFSQVREKKLGYKTDTGLGLAFCKLAVEAHGGRIWVESEPGKGCTFTFTVPRSAA